jgi:hypothetical protein
MNHIAAHLHDIHFNKRSGRLIFKREDVVKYFFFQDGELLQVKTNRPEERLGEVLFNLERLPKDTHARIEDYIEPNQNIGEALRKRGVISESDLEDALTQQLRETTLNTFPYFDGQLAFQERTDFAGVERGIQAQYPAAHRVRDPPDAARCGHEVLAGREGPVPEEDDLCLPPDRGRKGHPGQVDGLAPAEAVARKAPPPQELFWKSLFLFYCLDIVDLKGEGQGRGFRAGRYHRAETAPPVRRWRPRSTKSSRSTIIGRRRISTRSSTCPGRHRARTSRRPISRWPAGSIPTASAPDVAREYKKQIDDVFDAITNAYRTLSNKALRTAYDAKSAPPPQEDVQSAARMAETKFRQGKTLYSQERYNEAVSYLREAIRDKKDKGDYYLLLAMAEAKVPGYIKRAEEDFLKAISMEPWNPEAYVGLGMLYRDEGLKAKALKMFEKAVQTDPEHVAAREAFDELSGGGKKKGLKGLFSMDVFGSGKKKK